MKRKITLILLCSILLILFSGCSSSGSNTNSNGTASTSTKTRSATSTPEPSLSSSDIEYIVVGALISNIPSKYNASNSRYSIGSIVDEDSHNYRVKGTLSLYNDYGEFEDSGTFSMRIDKQNWYAKNVDIDIK